MPNKVEKIVIPKKISVFEDKKTLVKTVAFPFTFPDGKNGIISITRLNPFQWIPADSIESIDINFTKDDNKTA